MGLEEAGQCDCARPSVIKVRNQPSCLMESSRLISRVHFGLRLMDDLTLWLQSNYQLKGWRPGLLGLGEVWPHLNTESGKSSYINRQQVTKVGAQDLAGDPRAVGSFSADPMDFTWV